MTWQWQTRELPAHVVDVVVEETGDTVARELGPLGRDQRIVLDGLLYALAFEIASISGEVE